MGDTSRHLTYFKVENFKRFESFEMKDLGQFNLIVGDNNVGKTSVLEALLPTESIDETLNSLFSALNFRRLKHSYTFSDIELYANRSKVMPLNYYSIVFSRKYTTNESSLRAISIDKIKKEVNFHPIVISGEDHGRVYGFHVQANYNSDNSVYRFPYIPFYKGHDSDLTSFYSKLKENKLLKRNFIKSLSTIVSDLEDIDLSFSDRDRDARPFITVYLKHSDAALPLAMFGDGTLKLFRLLAEIILNRGGRLMIDEVDTGIYFKRFKEFWKVILLTAKENDVQLFMTTHNEECIRYFKEVLEEELPELQKDVRNITLVENSETKEVTAHTFDYDQFEHAINVGNEIRG